MHRAVVGVVLSVSAVCAAVAAQQPKPPDANPDAKAPAANAPEAAAPEWLTDLELAKTRARTAKLDLLLAFTAPDPAGLDARFESAMFAKPDFTREASKHFVLVRFDSPQRPQLLARYRSERLPALWLADARGVAYARIRWAPATTEALLALLAERRAAHAKSAEALQRAATIRGVERAKALAEGLSCLDDDVVVAAHGKELMEILAADADGSLGLKQPFDAIARDAAAKPFLVRLQDELQPLADKKLWAELDARIDAARTKHAGERWAEQYLTFMQAVRATDVEAGAAASLQLFEAALALAPRSELAPEIDRRRQEAAAAVAVQLKEEEERKKAEAGKKGKPKKN